MARTGFDACSARGAKVFVHYGQTQNRVNSYCSEVTCRNTVAASKASIAARRLTASNAVHGSTGAQAVIFCYARTVLKTSVAPHHGDLGSAVTGFHAEQTCYTGHDIRSADRTGKSFDGTIIGTFHKGRSKS
jgi:hypothetical protein